MQTEPKLPVIGASVLLLFSEDSEPPVNPAFGTIDGRNVKSISQIRISTERTLLLISDKNSNFMS